MLRSCGPTHNDPSRPKVDVAGHDLHGVALRSMSPTLLKLGAFIEAASLGSVNESEIETLFRYLGLDPPANCSVCDANNLRSMLAKEVERQNRYLAALSEAGWNVSAREYERSAFVDEIVRLNRIPK